MKPTESETASEGASSPHPAVRRLSSPQRSVWNFMMEDGGWFCSAGGQLDVSDNYKRLPDWFRGRPVITLRAMARKGWLERKLVAFGQVPVVVRWAVYRAIKPPNDQAERP